MIVIIKGLYGLEVWLVKNPEHIKELQEAGKVLSIQSFANYLREEACS